MCSLANGSLMWPSEITVLIPKDWIDILTLSVNFFGLVVIGGFLVYVGIRQNRITRQVADLQRQSEERIAERQQASEAESLRLSLLDRRFSVIECLVDAMRAGMIHGLDPEKLEHADQRLVSIYSELSFLFGAEILNYYKEFRDNLWGLVAKARDYQQAKNEIDPDDPETSKRERKAWTNANIQRDYLQQTRRGNCSAV